MEDIEIISKVKSGDIESFKLLMDKYSERVYRQCLIRTYNEEDSKILAQEIFMQAFKYINRFRFRSTFLTWLMAITKNKCKNFKRDNHFWLTKVVSIYTLITTENEEEGGVERQFPDNETPLDILIREQRIKTIRLVLSKLPVKKREILHLAFIKRMSYREIARLLKCPTSTVGVRILRASEEFRRKFLNTR